MVSKRADEVKLVALVCEAGMGSSVMGAAILQRRLQEAHLEIQVEHAALGELPAIAGIVVSHRSLAARVRNAAPNARTFMVDEFIQTPVYDDLVRELLNSA